jgi:hypothetical protein
VVDDQPAGEIMAGHTPRRAGNLLGYPLADSDQHTNIKF